MNVFTHSLSQLFSKHFSRPLKYNITHCGNKYKRLRRSLLLYCFHFLHASVFFFFFLNTHPLLYSLLNGFCPYHLSEIFLYRSIRPHFGQYQQSLFNYLFVINTAACSIKNFFFFHWLPVHSDFSSVLLFSFTDSLSLPIFKHLGVSGYHSFWCFLLKQVSVVGLRSIYQNHLDDFFKL